MYLGDEGNWRKTYYRGKTAYVSALYTTLYEMEKASDIIERVIEEGARLLGTPMFTGLYAFITARVSLTQASTSISSIVPRIPSTCITMGRA